MLKDESWNEVHAAGAQRAWEDAQRRSLTPGLTIPETAMAYGIALLVIVMAVVGFIYLSGQVSSGRVMSDVNLVVNATRGMFKNVSTYAGLTTEVMSDSERLPESLVVGDAVWVGGQNEGLEVNLFPAAGAATTGLAVGGNNARFFLMGVGTTAGPIRDVSTCVELVMFSGAGVRGVQVVPAVASATAAAGATATVAAAAASAAVGGSWRSFAGTNITALEGRTPPAAQTACTTVIDGNTAGGRVVYAFE